MLRPWVMYHACLAGCQNILLLGRSGRSALNPQQFGHACVAVARCDLACADEVRAQSLLWHGTAPHTSP